MKAKPGLRQGAKEITATLVGGYDQQINVRVLSSDAREFLVSECAQYGQFIPFQDGTVRVFVHPEYVAQEVADYINSYNDEEDK